MSIINQSDLFSPIDFRYHQPELVPYLSNGAAIQYQLKVELALVRALGEYGVCSKSLLKEVEIACSQVTVEEVDAEERRIKHDIRALVNCIRNRLNARVSEEHRQYIHMTATSYDIIDTTNALRFRDAILKVLVPSAKKLIRVLASLAVREADTVQIGRTHGQHAIPITFGFAIAGYTNRLGNSVEKLIDLADELTGKFSGAVGAYNASSLICDDPERFETTVLGYLDIESSEHSTQIVPPEAMIRLLSEVVLFLGVMADLSDSMRNLQRTEIAEIGEEFGDDQVGSSAMPQKQNPINFENSKSIWKVVMPRLMTVYMDQISEHQRDLTNSASTRTYGEIIAYTLSIVKRLTSTMSNIVVNHANMERNLKMSGDLILAEPLQTILSLAGCPDAHEKVRLLTVKSRKTGISFKPVFESDEDIQKYLKRAQPHQRLVLSDPYSYIGIASEKAREIAEKWVY